MKYLIGTVNDRTSIFHYASGLSHRDHNHPDFVPFFVDEYPEDQRNASRAACGGDSATQACIFDYLATGDKELAMSSGNTDSSNQADTRNIGTSTVNQLIFEAAFLAICIVSRTMTILRE